jgi:hypothetical protein
MQAPQGVHDLSAVDDQVEGAACNENRPVAARQVKRLEHLLVQHRLQSASGCSLETDSDHVCRRQVRSRCVILLEPRFSMVETIREYARERLA